MLNTQTLSENSVDKINNILEYLHDSYNGYHESSSDIENSELKAQFTSAANTRQQMIDELKQCVSANDETPSKHGTMAGAAHRLFVNLKSVVTGKNETAITNEVIRGESVLAEKYQDAISEVEESSARQVLTAQLTTINTDLNKWKATAEGFKVL